VRRPSSDAEDAVMGVQEGPRASRGYSLLDQASSGGLGPNKDAITAPTGKDM